MSGRRILLVDDSPTIRAMVSSLLEEEGYAVAMAVNGRLGFEAAKADPPELIVTDYEMPELDGPGLCRQLESDAALRGIPVIMLTTLGALESKLTGLDAGADDYFEKSHLGDSAEEFYARIRAQLRIGDLQRELAERNRQLEDAQAKMVFELELARKVQFALMPAAPRPAGLVKYGVKYRPVNRLGGDVYDFVRRPDGRLSIMVADVSGHGVNSAMLSGMVKTLATPLAMASETPAALLAELDQALGRSFPEEYFCTSAVVFLDEATGEFSMAGVGHPPVLKFGPNGVEQLTSDAGLLAIGFLEEALLTTRQGKLATGESLILYTDGLPDAMNEKDEMFGEGRIEGLVAENHGREPQDVIDTMETTVLAHTSPGQPADDINMVCVRRH
jgi:serine phosphatase RsbU (regulator of sigma subunit)